MANLDGHVEYLRRANLMKEIIERRSAAVVKSNVSSNLRFGMNYLMNYLMNNLMKRNEGEVEHGVKEHAVIHDGKTGFTSAKQPNLAIRKSNRRKEMIYRFGGRGGLL